MKDIKHHEMVIALAKPGADILASLTPEKAHALHMVVGVSGEVAELLEGIHGESVDIENVKEELGDIEFYLSGARHGFGINHEETLAVVCDGFIYVDPTIGAVVEAGKLLDVVKKYVIYNKTEDRAGIVDAMGRFEHYLAKLRLRAGLSRDETLTANIAKLGVRYQGLKYSDKAAQDRVDKVQAS